MGFLFNGGRFSDEIILLARILLMILFVIFGWEKVTGFSGTVVYFTHVGAPLPQLSAVIAVVMELFVGLAVVAGVLTRPLAVLLALYTLATAVIGHHYWNMTGADRAANEINFFKNVSIAGGLLLLFVTGAGKYSVDAAIGRKGLG